MTEKPLTFSISPLIRLTLLSFYLTLTLPLPWLAQITHAPVAPRWLVGGLALGWLILWGALSEKVILKEEEIQVTYPRWFAWLFRQGWSLPWGEIQDLKSRTTGQGGLVYYFTTPAQDRAYLLPMRVAGFKRLVEVVEKKTGIDTRDVRPLSQPWMYVTLLVLTVFLLLIDIWLFYSFHNTTELFRG